MIKKIKDYAKRLCEEDTQIEEVVLIGSFANGTATNKSDIDLVCVFDEECEDKDPMATVCVLYGKVRELRDKFHQLEKKIGRSIDLGFITADGDIFMGGGLISNYAGKSKLLAKRSEVKP